MNGREAGRVGVSRISEVRAASVERMPEHHHDELAARRLERRLQPRPLRGVHASGDARVDGDQGELLVLDLEERRALPPDRDAVLAAERAGSRDERLDVAVGGAGDAFVGLDAGAHGEARGRRLEEGGGEALERVVPVVVAGNGIDRHAHPLERQPEVRLVVAHRAGGIHHIGRQHHEPDVGLPGGLQQRVAQHVLRGIPFTGVADDDEREIARRGQSVWHHGEGRGARPTGCDAITRRTMASRHVSVRASAQEFQMPAAQFSVSKYQLMPHTGTVAAITAAAGRPMRKPRRSALARRVAGLAHADGEAEPSLQPEPRHALRQP